MQATDRITLVLRAKEGETLEQVLPFVQLGAPVSIGRGLAVIAGASDEDLQMVPGREDLENFPDPKGESMHIDDRVRMAANAKRYEWLRDRDRVTDFDSDLCVARDDTVYFGHDLDKNVDDAMRLARLVELHP